MYEVISIPEDYTNEVLKIILYDSKDAQIVKFCIK